MGFQNRHQHFLPEGLWERLRLRGRCVWTSTLREDLEAGEWERPIKGSACRGTEWGARKGKTGGHIGLRAVHRWRETSCCAAGFILKLMWCHWRGWTEQWWAERAFGKITAGRINRKEGSLVMLKELSISDQVEGQSSAPTQGIFTSASSSGAWPVALSPHDKFLFSWWTPPAPHPQL